MLKRMISRIYRSLGELIILPYAKQLSHNLLENQKALFDSFGLSFEEGLQRLDETSIELDGRPFDETDGLNSQHFVMFAAISKIREIDRILEIGTYDGRAALFMSKLFPQAEIITLDLKDDDDLFVGSYGRKESLDAFIRIRNSNLEKCSNLTFLQMNSVELIDTCEEKFQDGFDLIWIDGAHNYPVVAFDILNAVRLANDDAILAVDDVWVSDTQVDSIYKSRGAFESWSQLEDVGLIDNVKYILKRIAWRRNVLGNQKFIGIARRVKRRDR